MRSIARVILTVAVVGVGPVLSACSPQQLDSFDPTAWFDTKKKLAGKRKPVFPNGVPGVTSGVPPELVKGYREPEGGLVDPAKAAAEAAAKADRPKKPEHTARRRKPKPKPPADQSSTAEQPPPQQQGGGGGWPSPQQPAPWPGSR